MKVVCVKPPAPVKQNYVDPNGPVIVNEVYTVIRSHRDSENKMGYVLAEKPTYYIDRGEHIEVGWVKDYFIPLGYYNQEFKIEKSVGG